MQTPWLAQKEGHRRREKARTRGGSKGRKPPVSSWFEPDFARRWGADEGRLKKKKNERVLAVGRAPANNL
jgi:hypothetical protein